MTLVSTPEPPKQKAIADMPPPAAPAKRRSAVDDLLGEEVDAIAKSPSVRPPLPPVEAPKVARPAITIKTPMSIATDAAATKSAITIKTKQPAISQGDSTAKPVARKLIAPKPEKAHRAETPWRPRRAKALLAVLVKLPNAHLVSGD